MDFKRGTILTIIHKICEHDRQLLNYGNCLKEECACLLSYRTIASYIATEDVYTENLNALILITS